MHDEYEVQRLLISHAVEYQHRLHREMPGAGAIRRRHDDSEVTHDEAHQRTAQSKPGCEVEAEERQVEMQEVTAPDADGIEEVQR